MNISMVSGLMPVVGIPLPLISYGGTVMLSIMISIGMVLNIELNHNLKKGYVILKKYNQIIKRAKQLGKKENIQIKFFDKKINVIIEKN